MIKSLKITDGDYIFINLGPIDTTKEHIDQITETMRKWLQEKNLKNVNLNTGAGFGDSISGVHMSVNDVFENTVLKGDSDD